MQLDEMFKAKIQEYLTSVAYEIKAAIEYEFSVEYGEVHIGDPVITEDSISFDLSGLSDYEKELLNDIYYENAKKRRQKGGGENAA